MTDLLPKPLRDLDTALAALSDDTMTLSQLDGLVAALVLSPEPIPPEEWLPHVWGQDDDGGPPPFVSHEQAARLTAQVLAHHDGIEWLLRRTPDDYAPVLDHDARTGETFWEFWIEGFELAMSLRPEAWTTVIERPEGDDAAHALALLLTLYAIMSDDPELEQTPEQVADLSANGADLIPGCVAVLADALLEPAPRATPLRRPKVGRNDPCPCGSGRKFKKCCAGAGD